VRVISVLLLQVLLVIISLVPSELL
jgi:hypothetical protein